MFDIGPRYRGTLVLLLLLTVLSKHLKGRIGHPEKQVFRQKGVNWVPPETYFEPKSAGAPVRHAVGPKEVTCDPLCNTNIVQLAP